MDWEFPRVAPTHKDSVTPRPRGRVSHRPLSPPSPYSLCAATVQRSWKFTSLSYMHTPNSALTVADELESFFYVLLYTAALHLPSNLLSPDDFLHDFFNYTLTKKTACGWSVSEHKQLALRQARILCPTTKDELWFVSGTLERNAGQADDAFNALVQEYLGWCHAAYVRSDAGRKPRRNLPRRYRNPALEGRDLAELERKLEGYEAVLALFADALEALPEEKKGNEGEVVKSEPREEEVPAEEFWKAMAERGGNGEGTEVAGAAEAYEEHGMRRRKLPTRQECVQENKEEAPKAEAKGKARRGTKRRAEATPAEEEEDLVQRPTRSSRRIRGEPAPDAVEIPAKRRRRL